MFLYKQSFSVYCLLSSVYCLLSLRADLPCPVRYLLTPPPPSMSWGAKGGGVSHTSPADKQQQQQQQQQQQWGHSPHATHAYELYRACVAAGQLAKFSVELRVDGEYFHLSSRPPTPHTAAATQIAAARGVCRQGRRPNTKRVEKFRAWRRSKAAAKRATQQPKESVPAHNAQQQQQRHQQTQQQQQQQQQQANVSESQQQQQPKQHNRDSHSSCQLRQAAWSTIETRSSKKRRIALSPGGAAALDPALPGILPSPPSPGSGDIPQMDGAEEAPMTPTPDRSVTPPFKDPPTPPPMSPFFPTDPNRVICHVCLKNVHFLMYEQCEFCHYRMKFAYKKL